VKASELIKELQKIIDTHGDDEVSIYVSEAGYGPDEDDFTDAFPVDAVEVSKAYNSIVLYH
jgi:hypothetical protein